MSSRRYRPVGLAPSVMRPLPASFSLLAVDARPTCTHHSGADFERAIPQPRASTRKLRYPRRFAANRAFHRHSGTRRATCGTRATGGERQANEQMTCRRDKAVQVSLSGFGQRENPICERPRHLAVAITSSNFVLALLRSFRSACTARPVRLLHRELPAARPPTLPSACLHHSCRHSKRAIGQSRKRPLVHKKLSFSTQFPKIPHNPQPLAPSRRAPRTAENVRWQHRRGIGPPGAKDGKWGWCSALRSSRCLCLRTSIPASIRCASCRPVSCSLLASRAAVPAARRRHVYSRTDAARAAIVHAALQRTSGQTQVAAASRQKASQNATRPPRFPQSASISTRIDLRVPSLTCICQDGVELRVGVSFKCDSACTAPHRFCAGELLVARPSSLPPT